MLVSLIGLGGGGETVTDEARAVLEQADAVIGSPRLLDALDGLRGTGGAADTASPGGMPVPGSVPVPGAVRVPEVRPDAIAGLLSEQNWARPCVVYSGDTGFHSGAAWLIPLLRARGISFRVLPGLSSIQLLAARLGRPWQDWRLVTAHGIDCDPVPEMCSGVPVFFLAGPGGAAVLCARLAEAGLADLPVTIGENLSLPGERVVRTTAGAAAGETFAPLSVLLAEAAPGPEAYRTPGLPDSLFRRGDVPMTKQLIRAAVLSLLEVRPDDILWDIGAGTGSVSIELALAARRGRVFAVERRDAARELILDNRLRFRAWNLSLAGRDAPEDLSSLPTPDGVFLGGTGGRLAEIADAILQKNPAVRLCAAAVTLETLSAAADCLTARGLDPEVIQLAVSRTGYATRAGTSDRGRSLHLLRAENPVFLIAARGSTGPSALRGEKRPW